MKAAVLALLMLWPAVVVMAEISTTSMRVFRNFSAADGLADNSAQIIACTKTGRLVITTMGQINFYDGQRFIYIDPTDENVFPLDSYRGNYHLYFDRYHHIWLKNTYSVTCVDLTTEKFSSSVEKEFQKFGVTDKVKDLFVDSENIVWLLTDKGLYNVETKQTIKIRRDLNLQDLEVFKGNQLLLFYESGLLETFDVKTGQKIRESYPYGESDRKRYQNTSVLKMDKNLLYQVRNGDKESVLNQYDMEKHTWKEILRVPYHLNNIAQNDTLLYLPSEFGYWVYDIKGDKLKHAETLQLEGGRLLQTDINVMCFDRQGGLWAGTEKRGLLYSMPYKSPFKVYSWGDKRADDLGTMMEGMDRQVMFRHRPVNCVTTDSRGWTWVGTSQGLQLYRKPSDVLPQLFTKKDGLLNNVVHSVVEDHMHCMWVATSYGITSIQITDGKVGYVSSYNRHDNIPNEMFVNGKAMCLPNGDIAMQSLDHVVTFNPNRMSAGTGAQSFELYPKLIRMMINGNEISTGQEYDGRVILDRAISRTYEIDLDYNQNSASLVFSALNFFRPQQTC
jgi:ligand-binding sensor domain-containing protein